jgi:hypothetical protein
MNWSHFHERSGLCGHSYNFIKVFVFTEDRTSWNVSHEYYCSLLRSKALALMPFWGGGRWGTFISLQSYSRKHTDPNKRCKSV